MSEGDELFEEDRRRLRDLIQDVGEREAVKRLGCSDRTVFRALAGLPIRRGSAFLITSRLGRTPTENEGRESDG